MFIAPCPLFDVKLPGPRGHSRTVRQEAERALFIDHTLAGCRRPHPARTDVSTNCVGSFQPTHQAALPVCHWPVPRSQPASPEQTPGNGRWNAPETGIVDWQDICGSHIRGGGKSLAAMSHHSLAHFLSERFPDLEHPRYQSVLETISFLIVTAMIAGAFAVALFLLFYEL
jgi:hypothetical protein